MTGRGSTRRDGEMTGTSVESGKSVSNEHEGVVLGEARLIIRKPIILTATKPAVFKIGPSEDVALIFRLVIRARRLDAPLA